MDLRVFHINRRVNFGPRRLRDGPRSRPFTVEQAMPRFHLHVRTPSEFIEDEEGIEVADYSSAIVEAVRGARCLMTGEVARGTLRLDQSIEIHDAAGQHVTSVPFSEALKVIVSAAQAGETVNAKATRPNATI